MRKTLAALIDWSESQFHELPWRKRRSLYGTLVSEIMLQQTTVGTVLSHFDRFLIEYPNLHKLSEASESQLTKSWKGLGYYRRARNLLKAAQYIVEHHSGKIPQTYKELIEIPGIGPYTANALLSIGMDQRALAVDANLERVISRLYAFKEMKGVPLQKKITQSFVAGKIFPEMKNLSFRALNEALMDLGRTICKIRNPSCLICPMAQTCEAYLKGEQELYPSGNPKEKKEIYKLELLRLKVFDSTAKKILVYEKGEKEWLAGQLELPTFILKSEDPGLKQYPSYQGKVPKSCLKLKTVITKYRIENNILELTHQEFSELFPEVAKQFRFVKVDQAKENFAVSTLKILGMYDL